MQSVSLADIEVLYKRFPPLELPFPGVKVLLMDLRKADDAQLQQVTGLLESLGWLVKALPEASRPADGKTTHIGFSPEYLRETFNFNHHREGLPGRSPWVSVDCL